MTIRLLADGFEDYAKLAKWLSDPRVLEFYEGRDHPLTPQQATETFNPTRMNAEGEIPCLILVDDRPVGYIQYYQVPDEQRFAYDLPAQGIIFGLDLFIGEPELWGHGVGKQTVNLMLDYLFSRQNASQVVLDPHASNLRAIRCYEACGFQKIKLLPAHERHEGSWRDCWLMGAKAA
jgi:aminoglycoside 6'-N-acetyltransferase